LLIEQVERIITAVANKYNFSDNIEISFESTPNKITKDYIENLKKI
jgi:coproporphyrinogen III oxidase-like Fe-S oxidoreductase